MREAVGAGMLEYEEEKDQTQEDEGRCCNQKKLEL